MNDEVEYYILLMQSLEAQVLANNEYIEYHRADLQEMITRQDELMGKLGFVKEAIDQMIAREENEGPRSRNTICRIPDNDRMYLFEVGDQVSFMNRDYFNTYENRHMILRGVIESMTEYHALVKMSEDTSDGDTKLVLKSDLVIWKKHFIDDEGRRMG